MKRLLIISIIALALTGCLGKPDIEELYVTKEYDKILDLYHKKPEVFEEDERIYVANIFYTKGEEEKAIKIYDEIFGNGDYPLYPEYQIGLENYEKHQKINNDSISIIVEGKEIYSGSIIEYEGETLIPLNPILNQTEGGIYVPNGEDYFYAEDQDSRLKEGMEYSIAGARDSCYGIFDSKVGSQNYTIIDYATDDPDEEGFEIEKSLRCPSVLKDGYLFLHPKDIDELIMDQLGWEMTIDGQKYIFDFVDF